MVDTPMITCEVPRELKDSLDFLKYVPMASPSVPATEMRRLMAAYTICEAVCLARQKIIVEADLSRVIPKPVRAWALDLAVRHHLLQKINFKGVDAWTFVSTHA